MKKRTENILLSSGIFLLLIIFLGAVFLFDWYRSSGIKCSINQLSDSSFMVIFKDFYGDSLYIGTPARFEYYCYHNDKLIASNRKDYVYNLTVKGAMPVALTLRNINYSVNQGDTLLFNTVEKYDIDEFESKVHFFTENTLRHSELPLFFTSNLPVVVIRTDTFLNDNLKHTGSFHFFSGNQENNILTDKPSLESRILIKVRGETSRSFPKKQYAVYFLKKNGNKKKIRLGDLPEDHEYVLNGPYIDVSEIRNALTYALYNKMGHWAPHTMFVELVINNDYRGLYLLTEKIKRTKIGLPKCDSICPASFMVKIDKPKEGWWEKGCFRLKNNEYIQEQNDRDLHYYFMTVCPKYEKGKTCVSGIYHQFDSVSKLIAAKRFDSVGKILDYETMIDYSILNELSKNVDAYRISTFFYKYPGGKLNAGPPWDYNFSYGVIDIEGGQDYKGFMFDNSITLFWWRYLYHYDEPFRSFYRKRWKELRNTVLSDKNLMKEINLMYSRIKNAAIRDYYKWGHIVRVKQNNNSEKVKYFKRHSEKYFDNSIYLIKNWILNRTGWIDEQIEHEQ